MPFSRLLLNSSNNKRKCVLSDNNETDDFYQVIKLKFL
jgi:hypothetical protein